MDRSKAGEALLHDILRTHGPALQRIARAYGEANGEADDLHQEILLQLWRAIPSFRGDSTPGTWCYRIALNTALTWRRQAARRDRQLAGTSTPVASVGSPRAEEAILAEFLAYLGPADRSILVLFLEDLEYAEIADVLGMSASAVGVRIHRIKQKYTERFLEG